jgi:hypothetical protein
MKNTMVPGIPLVIVLFAAVATVAVTTGTQDGAGHETRRQPGSPGQPPSDVEQMQYVFHELHPDGRNALCAVCDRQYRILELPLLWPPVSVSWIGVWLTIFNCGGTAFGGRRGVRYAGIVRYTDGSLTVAERVPREQVRLAAVELIESAASGRG